MGTMGCSSVLTKREAVHPGSERQEKEWVE